MLYLVRQNNRGEPVGVHNEAGQSAYKKDAGYFSADSAQRIADKHSAQSWDDFCQERATSFNPLSNWHSVEMPETEIHDVLSQVVQNTRYPDPEQ